MIKFDINADASVVFANKLEKIHRAALPNAVRFTLGALAKDVRENTMPKTAASEFTTRNKAFFRGTSWVNYPKGYDINQMQSVVGFTKSRYNSDAVDNLEQQERGGSIGKRTFVPLDSARKGGSHKNAVLKRYRTDTITNIVRAGRQKGGSRGARFIKATIKAGKGGHVIGQNGILYRVTRLNPKRGDFKLRAIYSFKKGRKPSVKPTGFMQKASKITAAKTTKFFTIEAKKQIKRFLK